MTDANQTKKLYLIEKDIFLINYLKDKYKNNKNIIIIENDIFKYNLNNLKDLVISSTLQC